MKPNLFEIATKELSQDAFFTWLASFADQSCQDEELHQCAKDFVSNLILSRYPNFKDDIYAVKAERQWNSADIVITVNNQYFILIEDKTNTGQHDKQLERYKENADNYCKEKGLFEPVYIYLKTGNECLSSLNDILHKYHYTAFDRRKILAILEKYSDIKNAIFTDFLKNLQRIEYESTQFKREPVHQWTAMAWQGFYLYLETTEIFNDVSWDYVANPNGGLYYCAFSWLDWKYNTRVYMQFESDKGHLAFKVETVETIDSQYPKSEIRNELYQLFSSYAHKNGFISVRKPERFGKGDYMTFCILPKDTVFSSNILNSELFIGKLVECKKLFEDFQKTYFTV